MPEQETSKQSLGGSARAAKLTSEQRSSIAKKAAEAKWAAPKATHTGELSIGELTIPCAVLPDGTRVLSQRGVGRALGRSHGGSDWRAQSERGGNLPFFLGAKGLFPFITNELLAVVSVPIEYRFGVGNSVAHGIPATALPMICDVWLKAREAGAISSTLQLQIAQRAEILTRGLAQVGIVGLVDEATGFQEVRDKLALQAILDKYLAKELAAWAKRFPDEFYKEIFRLRKWTYVGGVRRPQLIGFLTKDIVYSRLGPQIVEELEKKNPKNEKGRRSVTHHQWLTEDVGHPALAQHLHAVIALMRASDTWEAFKKTIDRVFPKRGNNLELEV